MSNDQWKTYFSGHWNFPGERQDRGFAAFPVELPRRLIRMFSFPGECVLDPFLGSGTTLLAARELERRGIGYELADAAMPVIRERLGGAGGLEAQWSDDIEFRQQAAAPYDPEAALGALPYRFHDPVRIQRHRQPRTRDYGSRIDRSSATPPKRQRVKAIETAACVRLDDGTRLGLIGIREEPDTAVAARQFLADEALGKRVIVEADAACPPESDGMQWGYLLLGNRKNLNAHLLKRGLAAVDAERTYRHRTRYVRYAAEASTQGSG